MRNVQTKAQANNVHQMPANAGFPPLLTDVILKVLSKSTTGMDAHEVFSAARRMFPQRTFNQGSIQSMLSILHRNGTINGVRATGDARTRYAISPLASGYAAKSVFPVPDPLVPSQERQASATSARDMKGDDRTISMSISASPELMSAITALVRHRHGVSDRKKLASFAQKTLPVFLNAKPYHDDRFCWTKFQSLSSIRNTLSFSLADGDITRQVVGLNHDKDLVKLGIAMDDARQSDGGRITFTMIGYTSIIWYLATCLTEEERAIPAVEAFLNYADENYRFKGRDVVETYRLIHQAAAVAKLVVAEEPVAVSASGCSSVDAGNAVDVDPAKDAIGEPGEPVMESPVEASGALQYGLTIKGDGADGLLVSFRLPPAVVGQLLCAVTNALEMLTRAEKS